jgi:RND family efflux transporter MFP subunit
MTNSGTASSGASGKAKQLAAIVLPLAAALTAAGCAAKADSAESEPAEEVASVGTHTAIAHDFHKTLELTADVLANKQVTLMSKLPGEVEKCFVAEGDAIAEGDPIVRLRQKDFKLALRQAKAQLAAAEAGVEAARAGLDTISAKHQRITSLYEKQAVTESTYEDVSGGKRASAAQLALAEAQLQLAGVAVDSARENLANTVVRAPFDGIIGKRLVDEGARLTAMPPTPIAVVVDLNRVKVVGAVSEKYRSNVEVGLPVQVIIDAVRPEPFEARIERAEPLVDPMSRSFNVQVVLQNPDATLQAGMSARMRLDLGNRTSTAVPGDVVLRSDLSGNRGTVFVIEKGLAVAREVTIGARDGDLREIEAGLAPGETVVRGGQELLSDGQRVRVSEVEEIAE